MISDTLFEAVTEIERYQKNFPNAYSELKVEIEKVKAVMNAMRSYLDFPPSDGSYPRYDAAVDSFRTEIASINVEGLTAALEKARASWPMLKEADSTEKNVEGAGK